MSKRTPLYDIHVAAGARIIDFAGWQMPVQYTGVLEEHRGVRSRAGLFDLSHMGELFFSGPKALAALQQLTTNDVSLLTVGQAQYSLLCRDDGGIVDDVIIYRLNEGYMMVVNAANIDKDVAWISARLPAGATMEDRSDNTALIAIQGPSAAAIMQKCTEYPLDNLYAFEAAQAKIGDAEVLLSRTGYTGEDGFEVYIYDNTYASVIWESLMKAGEPEGLLPVGLGARDTLRLEARLTLYGNDIDETTSPLEAGLGFFIRFDKGDFIGRAALAAQKAEGLKRRLVAFNVAGRGIPRHGYALYSPSGAQIGQVTSGSYAPSLERDIGMGYVLTKFATPGSLIAVDVRGKARPAEIVKGRFMPANTRRRP